MTRVLHVLDTDEFAGTEQHVLTLAAAQAAAGLGPAIACRSGTAFHGRAAALAGVGVVPLAGPMTTAGAIAALVRATGGGRFDLLHAHNGRSLLGSLIAGRVRGRPVVATQHFLDPAHATRGGWRGAASHRVHRWCAAAAAQTIAVSAEARRRMLARGEGRPDDVTVVHNGVADPRPLVRRPSAEVRAELGVTGPGPLVVAVARLAPEKGLDVLIRAMRAVLSSCPAAVCAVAGRGPERDRLHALAQGDGVGDRVRLLGFREDVPDLVAAADVFVLPSPAEPFGLAVVEAMALGRPVVACRAGGPAEIVVDGETGALVEPGNAAAMAAAIVRLAVPSVADPAGLAGRQVYERRFSAATMAQQTGCVYDRALGRR